MRTDNPEHLKKVKKNPALELVRAKSITILKRSLPYSLDILYPFISKIVLKEDEYYYETSKEIYRLFNILIEREQGERMRKKWKQIRDIVCMIMEYDSGYREPFQDISEEVDLSKFKLTKKPTRKSYNFGGKQ